MAARKESKAERFVSDMIRHRDIEFARIGMEVEVDGDRGTIVGMNNSCNLNVRYANQLVYGKHVHNCHPKWKVKYFGKSGEVIAHFDEDCRCLVRPERAAASG